jgi:non-homologous end joining protein Ku
MSEGLPNRKSNDRFVRLSLMFYRAPLDWLNFFLAAVRFVDKAEIDSRYWEKPYYLVPDGDEADEGYSVIRDALAQTRKVAIGQLIMHGRGHLVGIKVLGRGLMLSILRYGNEVRAAEPYLDRLTAKPSTESVALASELIERMTGRFEPEKMPDQYARAVKELVEAKIEKRAPEVQIAPEAKAKGAVINIMDALKARRIWQSAGYGVCSPSRVTGHHAAPTTQFKLGTTLMERRMTKSLLQS